MTKNVCKASRNLKMCTKSVSSRRCLNNDEPYYANLVVRGSRVFRYAKSNEVQTYESLDPKWISGIKLEIHKTLNQDDTRESRWKKKACVA